MTGNGGNQITSGPRFVSGTERIIEQINAGGGGDWINLVAPV